MTRILILIVRWIAFLLLTTAVTTVYAQTSLISGKLIEANDSVVPAASLILLQQNDSIFVKGTISNEEGVFTLDKVSEGDYLLMIQHLLYEKKSLPVHVGGSVDLGTIQLDNNNQEIEEVCIKATRPVVKMENNVLSYDATAASEKFVRNNAMEVLGDVPGILLKDESIQLLGVSQLNIAINGKPTTLRMDQVLNMLKAMPNTNVKEVQVMYAPPARYNVKGALINIVLVNAKTNEINGSVNAGYRQRRNPGTLGSLDLQYAKDKWEVNLLYSYDYDQLKQQDIFNINHTYNDTLYSIVQTMGLYNKIQEHQCQLSTDYKIDSLQTLSLNYSGNFTDNKGGPDITNASFTSIKGISYEQDSSFSTASEYLHNLKIDYSLKNKLNIGAEYTFYNDPETNNYVSVYDNQDLRFKTESNQTVNKWMTYANHSFKLRKIDFTYGANYSHSSNENRYNYFGLDDGIYTKDATQSTLNNFSESAGSAFVSLSKQISAKLSFDFSLKAEFDRMQKDSSGISIAIWNTLYWYPTFNSSYIIDNQYNHIFQLAIKSYATYPTYWQISPTTWYSTQYMLVQGNPELEPSQTYTSTLNYIYKRKYVLVLSYEYTRNEISQIPFASTTSFNTIALNENIDSEKKLTAAFVLPFNIGKYITINPTVVLMHQNLKNNSSADKTFDRSANLLILKCDGAISLWKKHGLKASVSGHYYGRGIQGIYDFEPSYELNCGLSCNLLKDKAIVSLKINDIFNSSIPKLNINYGNQQSRYNLDHDTRMLTLNFRYNFGRPIKHKKIEVDNSRFKRMK